MRARLFTRCGCNQDIRTTYPPAPEIILPLRNEISGWNVTEEPEQQKPEVRRFKLRNFWNDGPDASIADYLETNG